MPVAHSETAQWPYARPFEFGTGALVLLLMAYFGIVGLISGMDFALDQFARFWYFLLLLSLGFGIQVGLYVHLKDSVSHHAASRRAVAVSGTTSTLSMVSCCAHYLANIVPVLGLAGFFTIVAEYQTELFWAGLAFNAAGLAFVISRVVKARKEHTA
jgi:Cu+-exporting ATPase